MLSSKYRVTKEEFYSVPEPEFTPTWAPISHGKLAELVVSSLDSYALPVWKSEYGLSEDRQQGFAVFDIRLPHGLYQRDFTMSVGIRNSIDKTLAASICLGQRVFVCDNLCFSGEVIL